MRSTSRLCAPLLSGLLAACGSSPRVLPPSTSAIKRVVIIIQENHTFDTHFGSYCTAAPGSNPTCTAGPACCEAVPSKDPGTGMGPTVLTDAEHASYSPNHDQSCEAPEMDNGLMDKYVMGTNCSSPQNFAVAPASLVMPYWQLAAGGALADRYFQPMIGASGGNDMYFARAQYVFVDNQVDPPAIGVKCELLPSPQMSYTNPTIGDLLIAAQIPWAFYIDGYEAMQQAQASGMCPRAPAACAIGIPSYPCVYDPTDIPFQYYPSTRDNPAYMKDFGQFASDLASQNLPSVSFVKALGYLTEHPGAGVKLSDGVAFVTNLVQQIQASPVAASTLILVTYDEGGGYFDHVAPPPEVQADGQSNGTRVPLMVLGPFARKGQISHAVMEHSSMVKFIEWNWLGGKTGQLNGRDTVVNNLGSVLDPAATVTAVPED